LHSPRQASERSDLDDGEHINTGWVYSALL
jgi:hypothetical protein